ncbi:DUF5655 domain-containing protein [Colwellia psychrerythraea]|uniref:DUF5655 domain-containing protein n=1 Tax=Colwellia psychrerythraea TaxID=28229 RepID=A0A099KRZ1_COLPS|nr:DUF5655 domain-containing protein [Colwellia psychrerythraea]KGJ93519.1 Protein of unknown function DUF4287 [Colwellia psychrerythraea]
MDKALQTMINNMPEKTGKNLKEWLHILHKENIEKHSIAVKFLKTEYGVTHGFANTIVTLSKEQNETSEDLVVNQYKGKELLKPIYNLLISTIEQFGSDVVITPKKASVSLIRKKQFALIKPATKTRIDLGLKLKDIDVQGRLENSGPFGAMCTHRIQLHTIADIDAEVIEWLSMAYKKSV